MDATQCLQELLALIAEYHRVKSSHTFWLGELSDIREGIIEHLCSLTTWIEKGGFIPTMPQVKE